MANDDSFLGTLAAVDPADWGAMGAGLLSAPSWQQGLAAGMQGVQAGRTQRAAATRQAELDRMKEAEFEQQTEMRGLQMEKIQKGLDTGEFMKVSPGVVWDKINNEFHYADPAELQKITPTKAQKVEFQAREPIYAGGQMYMPVFNKSAGTWQYHGERGEVLNQMPEGSMRASDSLTGELGKVERDAYKTLGEENALAFDTGQQAERALALLSDPEVWTGFGAETVTTLKSAMISAGFATEDQIKSVSKMEELRNISLDFVMANVAKTKGAVSDREMMIFLKASPNLQNTVEGNVRILEAAKIVTARKQEQYVFMRERINKGMPYWRAEVAWEQYRDANPVFTDAYFAVDPGEKTPVPSTEAPALPNEPPAAPSIDDLMKKYQ